MNIPAQLKAAMDHSRAGNHAAAEQVCRQMIAANPADSRAWCHLGTTFLARRRYEEAASAYQRALQSEPHFTEAINNLAVASARMNRIDEAVEQFHRAAAQRPNWAEPYISMGNLFVNLDRLDDAGRAFETAARLDPKSIEAHELMGGVCGRLGRLEEAAGHFLQSLRIHPRSTLSHSNFLLVLNYHPTLPLDILLNEHRWFDRLHGQGLTPIPAHTNSRQADRRLRIGYVTPDFRRHAVAWYMLPVLAAHDRKQFEIFAYVQQNEPDDVAQRLRAHCSGWWSTVGKTDAQAAQKSCADGIDILIDLAGHTGGNRLDILALQPAPVQITYLGYPTTTGLSAVHYLLTDDVLDPPGETNFHTEELVRIPGGWCCWDPNYESPPIVPPPCAKNGYITFAMLHKLAKLNSPMFDMWTNVMKAVPDSRLLVYRNTMDQSVRQRMTKELGERGIDPQRLIFHAAPYKDGFHLSTYDLIDISLDSLPWSGHATTCESLWMGVPMITLRGNRHAGRMSASILNSIGLDEFIAETPGQYVSIISNLARDTNRLAQLRNDLRGRMKSSALCDGPGFTRKLETIFRQVWCRWCES